MSNSSEALDILNLVLGIVGTITGSIAVFIHAWTFRKENPRLEVEEVDCEHNVTTSESNIKTVSFWATFVIKNLGDRGTSIRDIELTFDDNGSEHWMIQRYFKDRPEDIVWIHPHQTLELSADFYDTLRGSEKENIECTFLIYHTHGVKDAKAISQKKREERASS